MPGLVPGIHVFELAWGRGGWPGQARSWHCGSERYRPYLWHRSAPL